MANVTYNYGASPLGLIPEDNNFKDAYKETNGSFDSIFTSATKYTTLERKGKNRAIFSRNDLHNNTVYDTSTEKIIEEFKDIHHLALKYSDFAYLRDFGLYPNNRLMILRRFPNPVFDDIYSDTNEDGPGRPIATVIGYIEPVKDILTFDFNEEWTKADTNFIKILNEVGKDFRMDKIPGLGQKGLGTHLSEGAGMVPLPGASELFQRSLAKKLGLISGDGSDLPVGDPNLIREAMARRIPDGESFTSGLKSIFTITMKVNYELKYIHGVDPTLVYGDIVNLLLNMGTSESKFFLGGGDRVDDATAFLTKLQKDPKGAIKQMVDGLMEVIKDGIEKLKGLFNKAKADNDSTDPKADPDAAPKQDPDVLKSLFDGLKDVISNITVYLTAFLIAKYRVSLLGVIASMTGGPSTPWHLTIGNPLRPIFCSGDMYVKQVKVTMGPQLSFNDLPTHISADIQLSPARNLGLQEIHRKFQCGTIRTSVLSSSKHLGLKAGHKESFWSQKSGFFDIFDGDKLRTPTEVNVNNTLSNPTAGQSTPAAGQSAPAAGQSAPGVEP